MDLYALPKNCTDKTLIESKKTYNKLVGKSFTEPVTVEDLKELTTHGMNLMLNNKKKNHQQDQIS